jgi:purine-cytosine permease-like protein
MKSDMLFFLGAIFAVIAFIMAIIMIILNINRPALALTFLALAILTTNLGNYYKTVMGAKSKNDLSDNTTLLIAVGICIFVLSLAGKSMYSYLTSKAKC